MKEKFFILSSLLAPLLNWVPLYPASFHCMVKFQFIPEHTEMYKVWCVCLFIVNGKIEAGTLLAVMGSR